MQSSGIPSLYRSSKRVSLAHTIITRRLNKIHGQQNSCMLDEIMSRDCTILDLSFNREAYNAHAQHLIDKTRHPFYFLSYTTLQ